MTQLIMTLGLPASGKSTWAEEQVLRAKPGKMVRITKDQLRAMLHGGRHHGKNEKQILHARNVLIRLYLSDGIDVIVDDTNFNPIHEKHLREIAEDLGATFVVEGFTSVPLEECIKRDLLRQNSVGEKVIRDMYNKYIKPAPAPAPVYLIDKPHIVIVDIDGTIALNLNGRSPFAWDRVNEDTPNWPVVRLVEMLEAKYVMPVFMSGRDSVCREATEKWIATYCGFDNPVLFMRAAGDVRKDSIVKRELYEAHIVGKYNVSWVLDDRNSVAKMWRDLGLTCLQVADGDF